MALGDTNINTTNVGTETGSTLKTVSGLVGLSGLNKYSYYAPGQLTVDASKNIILTPPVNNFKLGDFRSYNHIAIKPSILTPADPIAWGPGGTTTSFTMNYRLESLNLYAFLDRGDYVTMDFYGSAADRTALVTRRHRQLFTIPVAANTALIGHTRQSTHRPNTSGWIQSGITEFSTAWLNATTTDVFVSTYVTDGANTRKINFGTAITDSDSSLVLKQNVQPYANGKNTNVPAPPAGYTAILPALALSAVAVCSYVANVDQALGSTYDFRVVAKGIHSSGTRIVAIDSTNIILTLNGVRTILATAVALSHSAGLALTGTLGGGASWAYNDIGDVTFETATIAAEPAFTQC